MACKNKLTDKLINKLNWNVCIVIVESNFKLLRKVFKKNNINPILRNIILMMGSYMCHYKIIKILFP